MFSFFTLEKPPKPDVGQLSFSQIW